MAEGKTVITLICERAAEVSDLLDKNDQISGMPDVKVVKFPCSGMIQPLMVEAALKAGASGVVICGCQIGDCYFREGNKMIRDRLLGARPPGLKKTVDRRRVMALWLSRPQKSRFLSETQEFVEYVARLDKTEAAKPAPAAKPVPAAVPKAPPSPTPPPAAAAPQPTTEPAKVEPVKVDVATAEPKKEAVEGDNIATTASTSSGVVSVAPAAETPVIKVVPTSTETAETAAVNRSEDEAKAEAAKTSLAQLKDVSRAGEAAKEGEKETPAESEKKES